MKAVSECFSGILAALLEFLNLQPLKISPFSPSAELAQSFQGFGPSYPSLLSHSL
jgi:hypothetical protein